MTLKEQDLRMLRGEDLSTVRFISIDPSLRNTGLVYGVIDHSDLSMDVFGWRLFTTKKSKEKDVLVASDIVNRTRSTLVNILKFTEVYRPHVCFAELPSGSKSSNAMRSYGVSCAFIGILYPPALEVKPSEVKKIVSGKNSASKKDIIDYVARKYPNFTLETKSNGDINLSKMEHVADAVVIAEAGIEKYGDKIFNNLHKSWLTSPWT